LVSSVGQTVTFGKISLSLDALFLTCSGLVRDEHELFNHKFFFVEVSNFMDSFQTCFLEMKTQIYSFL